MSVRAKQDKITNNKKIVTKPKQKKTLDKPFSPANGLAAEAKSLKESSLVCIDSAGLHIQKSVRELVDRSKNNRFKIAECKRQCKHRTVYSRSPHIEMEDILYTNKRKPKEYLATALGNSSNKPEMSPQKHGPPARSLRPRACFNYKEVSANTASHVTKSSSEVMSSKSNSSTQEKPLHSGRSKLSLVKAEGSRPKSTSDRSKVKARESVVKSGK